jgi:hypothetical protein
MKTTTMLFLIGFIPCLQANAAPADETWKPNIVFILANDLGYADTGFRGSDFYETPHLDRLAQESLRFTDAYQALRKDGRLREWYKKMKRRRGSGVASVQLCFNVTCDRFCS